MKIKRTTANKILSHVIQLKHDCFLGFLNANEILISIEDVEHLKRLMQEDENAIVVFNQHADATDCVDQIEWPDGQRSIEIFLDTEGVFGLRAYRVNGKIQTPELLELAD